MVFLYGRGTASAVTRPLYAAGPRLRKVNAPRNRATGSAGWARVVSARVESCGPCRSPIPTRAARAGGRGGGGGGGGDVVCGVTGEREGGGGGGGGGGQNFSLGLSGRAW